MGFQTQVNRQQAPAIAGDFASANPRASMLATEGTLVAGVSGVTVGVFAWADADGVVTNAKATGGRIGFVHREQQATITTWMSESGNTIQAGRNITLMVGGDYWAKFADGATIGQKVFASDTDGSVKSAAAGATVSGYTETGFKVASTAAAGELAQITTWG